ncbi:MAG: molybdopterin cofactor-binding domain-containing protein [Gammaproteobacteria bacterium]
MALTRRQLIGTGVLSGLAVGGGFGLVYARRLLDDGDAVAGFAAGGRPGETALNAWLRIGEDGRIVCGVHRAEMGQGVTTSLPMLLAEELDADWRQVSYEFTPVDKDYFNFGILLRGEPLGPTEGRFWARTGTGLIREAFHQLGMSLTISSSSTIDAWDTLRQAGAEARGLLVTAAAARWSVPAGRLVTAESVVSDPETGRTATYGELAADAARQRPTGKPVLKQAGDFRLLGRSLPRLDVPAKVAGTARFSIDTMLPGMLFGAVRHSPRVGGRIGVVDARVARAIPGVVDVVTLGDRAVAVLAGDTWTAQRAAAALVIEPVAADPVQPDSADLQRSYRESLETSGTSVFRDDEGVPAALAAGGVTAIYELPFLAHACMEPMNCTALYEPRLADARLTVWAPTQAPSIARDEAAKAAGLLPEQVEIRSTLMGGGFGRRAEMDFVIEAARAAKAVPGRPVKLTWSRQEDLRHDMYRPAATGRVRGALGAGGRIAALDYTLVSESVVASNFRRTPTARGGEAAKDKSALGGAFSPRYALPLARMAYVPREDGIPVGFWRSVSNSINPFLLESFVDELAFSANVDPVEFRLLHLTGLPAEQAVLRAAARLGRWDQPLPQAPGRRFGRGVAFIESHDSLVALVVEVSVADDGALRVERIACVVDCRTVVHPDSVEAQITGGILDGLNAALQGRITIRDGAVEQGNFNDYPWLRLADIPEIVVELLPQGGRPGGVGEPGVPAVAPALVNAIFAATGQRIRSLPVGATVGAPSGATPAGRG